MLPSKNPRKVKRDRIKRSRKDWQKPQQRDKTPKKIKRSNKNKQNTIKLDRSVVLAFVNHLIATGQITHEELGLSGKELKESLKARKSPLAYADFEVINGPDTISKDHLRTRWLSMMAQNKLYCSICGKHINKPSGHRDGLTFEHYIPKSKGGASDSTNLTPAHSECNSLKGNYMPNEWEQIGLSVMASRGIEIDFKHVFFDYQRARNYPYIIYQKEK